VNRRRRSPRLGGLRGARDALAASDNRNLLSLLRFRISHDHMGS